MYNKVQCSRAMPRYLTLVTLLAQTIKNWNKIHERKQNNIHCASKNVHPFDFHDN